MKASILAGLFCASAFGAPATVHLVQKPAMNKTEIVFSYSGDLWKRSIPADPLIGHSGMFPAYCLVLG